MDQQKSQEPSPDQQPESRPRSSLVRYSTMATQMGITIFLGVWGGIKLDEKFGGDFPLFTLVLSLLAVGIAMYMVIRDFISKK